MRQETGTPSLIKRNVSFNQLKWSEAAGSNVTIESCQVTQMERFLSPASSPPFPGVSFHAGLNISFFFSLPFSLSLSLSFSLSLSSAWSLFIFLFLVVFLVLVVLSLTSPASGHGSFGECRVYAIDFQWIYPR